MLPLIAVVVEALVALVFIVLYFQKCQQYEEMENFAKFLGQCLNTAAKVIADLKQ